MLKDDSALSLCLAVLSALVLACQPSGRGTGPQGPGFAQGSRVHALPMQTGAATAPLRFRSPTAPTCSTACSFQYYGGNVIPNVKPYVVLWTSAVTLPGSMAAFFQAVTSNDYWDWLDEYDTNVNATAGSRNGDAGTSQLIGRGVYGGQYTITPSVTATTVDDTQIQAELDAQIKGGNLPVPDANSIFMVYFPAGYTITQGASSSCSAFCAYHGTFSGTYTGGSQDVFYGVFPDYTQGGCASGGCGTGTAFQNLCSASSHELGEATTDSDVGIGSTVDYPLAWYDPNNGEIGDVCNGSGHSDTIQSIFDGSTYTVQQLYSRTTTLCQTTRYAATDFKVWLNPNTASLVAGSIATVSLPVSTAVTSGAGQTLALSVSGLPANVTGSLGAASLSAGSGTTLTLSAAAATAASKDVVGVLGASNGSLTHTAGFLVQVTVPASDFSLSANPAAPTVAQGGSAPVTVSTSTVRGPAETISLSVVGLPTGVTASFNPASVAAGGSSTMTLSASSSAALGAAAVQVLGTSPSTEKAAAVAATVVGPPAAAVTAPADGSTVQGTQTVTATGAAAGGAALTRVELYLDGALLSSAASSPLSAAWDTTRAANGSHTLVAKAYESGGGSGASSPVTVTVNNAAPAGGSDGGTSQPPGRSHGCSSGPGGGEDLLFGPLLLGLAALMRLRARPQR